MEARNTGITIALIIMLSGENDLRKIKSLNFYSKSNKIKKIENLEECINLQSLTLCYNYITKIENLASLIKLKTLDLSENSIKKLENLNTLVSLEFLNLSGNLIKELDKENLKGLISLSSLSIAKNKIARISEFANLEVLKSLQKLQTAGNLVKQTDLKEFIPLKVTWLKELDGEAVSSNANQNASMWVIKENLKDLKISLNEKCEKLCYLNKELTVSQDKARILDKSAPDKKYMRELLDKADMLHLTSVNLQQNMTQSRDNLQQLNTRLEIIRNTEKETGNYIVEEIKLIDETKRLKENIENMEMQYGLILEELELVASEITKIDELINNTPKFQSSEAKNLDISIKETTKSIDLMKDDIEKTKEKINEYEILLGRSAENSEISKIFDSAWRLIASEVWIEESENIVAECKRFTEKTIKIIDKERAELKEANMKHTEDTRRFEGKIIFLESCLKEEKDKSKTIIEFSKKPQLFEFEDKIIQEKVQEIANLEKKIKEMTKDLNYIETLITERSSRLEELSRKQSYNTNYISESKPENQGPPKTPDFALANHESLQKRSHSPFLHVSDIKNIDQQDINYKILEKLSEVLQLPLDARKIYSGIDNLARSIEKFKEKCKRFKSKKDSLIGQYMQKNIEISERIKKINQEKADLAKEKNVCKQYSEEAIKFKQERNKEEEYYEQIRVKKEEIENDKAKLEIRVKGLREELEILQEKRFKLLLDIRKLQEKYDTENEKYEELTRKVKALTEELKNSTGKLEEIERNKDIILTQNSKLKQSIEEKQNFLKNFEQKIEEIQRTHKIESENFVKSLKLHEDNISCLESEIQQKKDVILSLNNTIQQCSAKKLEMQKESQNLETKCNEYRSKASSSEDKVQEIDLINKHLCEDIRKREFKLSQLDKCIKEKEDIVEKLENRYLASIENAEILKNTIRQLERSVKDISNNVDKKHELHKYGIVKSRKHEKEQDFPLTKEDLIVRKSAEQLRNEPPWFFKSFHDCNKP